MRLEGPYKRPERRLIHTKGSLRCQWCYRWTEIYPGYDWASLIILKRDFRGKKQKKPRPGDPIGSFQTWQEYVEVNASSFRCSRETCVADRRQVM